MLTVFMFRVTATTSVRRGRGKNKNKKLKELTKDGPIDIKFQGRERYPVGDNARFFSRLIGEVLSDHCDLHHDSWTEVPSEMVQILKKPCEGTKHGPLFVCIMPIVRNNVTKF
jgi:hypothetical protein